MPTARYGPRQLWQLWIANGGSAKQAPIAVAVALAESRGNPQARHVNTNGTVDQGLWQINSSNYSGSDIYNPNVNARWAIRLSSHGRGWRNWTTFTSGAYRKFLPKRGKGETSVAGSKGFGVFSDANYAGTDQGVDFKGTGPIPALGSGVVTDVGKASIIEGGTYPYVVYRLTSGPYKGHFVYIAENFVPTVKRGTKLKLGQEVGKAVGAYPYIEVGFNKTGRGWNPVAPLNPNPHSPKPAGEMMYSYIKGVAKLHPGTVISGAAGVGSDIASGFSTVGGDIAGSAKSAYNFITDPFGSVFSGIAKAIDTAAHDVIYAGAIFGGGVTFIIGFLLIAADIGLSSRAGKVVAAVPAGRYIAKGARSTKAATGTSKAKSNIPSRKEERAEELHQAKVKTEKARATELRTRTRHRRATKAEQKKAEEKAYYRGATDAASPTMAKIKRERGKRNNT
jgi:hypothetical protein